MAKEIMIELQDLSNKVNDALNYVNEYKRAGMKANTNDMMTLYKVISEYEKKISDYLRNTSTKTNSNNQAQYVDLVARREDAHDNKRILASIIAESMNEKIFDAEMYRNELSKNLTEKEKSKKEVTELLDALNDYNRAMKSKNENDNIDKADSKQKLIDACIKYVKQSAGNPEASNVVYDMVAVLGEQNVKAFNKLNDDNLKKMATRRFIGYQSKDSGKFKTFYINNSFANTDAPEEMHKLVEKIDGKSQSEKETEYEKYLYGLYGNDRYAKFTKEDKAQADKELGANATVEARNNKLGEIVFKKMPWNNIKLDDTTASKEKFAHRQEVMRQWFPDDTKLLYGATAEKNKARNYYSILTNGTYNGFFRSFNNSPEYTELIKALYKYTKTMELNVKEDEKQLMDVKTACTNYLDHFEKKEEKHKTEFAIMRRDKVKELLNSLNGISNGAGKEAGSKKGEKINVNALETPKKDAGKTKKQSKAKTATKEKELKKTK